VGLYEYFYTVTMQLHTIEVCFCVSDVYTLIHAHVNSRTRKNRKR